mmetsp:Transcript_3758/g.4850  ORF Transcript_3758/g.4850 Transcript_3758/m.4850 type:complete len:121 (-) Transcript_3758:14-376(-)
MNIILTMALTRKVGRSSNVDARVDTGVMILMLLQVKRRPVARSRLTPAFAKKAVISVENGSEIVCYRVKLLTNDKYYHYNGTRLKYCVVAVLSVEQYYASLTSDLFVTRHSDRGQHSEKG